MPFVRRLEIALILATILLVCGSFSVQASVVDDGEQWARMNYGEKMAYLRGMTVGMGMYQRMAFRVIVDKQAQTAYDLLRKTTWKTEKYLSNISFDEALAAMDKLYGPPRNRQIKMYDAFWLVVRKLNGENIDADLKEMVR